VVKIHNIYHSGANLGYLQRVLLAIQKFGDIEVITSNLTAYNEEGNIYNADVLIYQTFPEQDHLGKFNPALVKRTDNLFREFRGYKILVDAHDNGEEDAYKRFKNPEIPRIKCFPSYRYLRKFNVILMSTINTKDENIYPDQFDRTVTVSCKFGVRDYGHGIRESVINQLTKYYSDITNFEWVDGRSAYIKDLRRTLIAVAAPGWGQYNATHQCALRTGALLFAYDSLNDIQYLPYIDLKDGFHFVSYNLFNFRYKLKWLLDNPDEIHRIRKAGREAFAEGYDIEKSADQLYINLKANVRGVK